MLCDARATDDDTQNASRNRQTHSARGKAAVAFCVVVLLVGTAACSTDNESEPNNGATSPGGERSDPGLIATVFQFESAERPGLGRLSWGEAVRGRLGLKRTVADEQPSRIAVAGSRGRGSALVPGSG